MNLPIIEDLLEAKCLMFVGMGGGYDIFGAIPLKQSAFEARWSNGWSELSTCVFVNGSGSKEFVHRQTEEDDFPQKFLPTNPQFSYTVGRHGVQLLREAYQKIVDEHKVDIIIGIDGGIDSLMRGDEVDCGTVLEDFVTLAALDEVTNVDCKFLVCLGFGTETEEGINHYRALENISELAKNRSFLGTCSLTLDSYQSYKDACSKAFAAGRVSHIQSKVIAAVEGYFGEYDQDGMDAQLYGSINDNCFISPLSSIYWFFDMQGVVRRNLLVEELKASKTYTDAFSIFRNNFSATRSNKTIPL